MWLLESECQPSFTRRASCEVGTVSFVCVLNCFSTNISRSTQVSTVYCRVNWLNAEGTHFHCTQTLDPGGFKWEFWPVEKKALLYLVVTLLGEEATLSDDQVEGSTCHQQAVTHVTKHHRKQEGESDDGVGSCNRRQTRGHHHTTRPNIRSRTPPLICGVSGNNWILSIDRLNLPLAKGSKCQEL